MDNLDFNKIYSYSKLKLFDQCPKAYNFTYLDEVYKRMKAQLRRDPANIWPWQILGRAVHDAITLFFYLAKEEQTLANLKNQLKFSWRAEAMKQKLPPLGKWGGFKTLKEEKKYYKTALEMLINFYKTFNITAKIKFLPTKDILNSIEDYKKLIQPLNENYDVSGKFDLVVDLGSGLSVVDFKTSQYEEKNNFQLKFYKLLAELNFNQPVLRASFYYLKTGNIKKYELNALDKEKIKNEVLAKIDQIKKEKKFATKPSPLCKYCLFRNFCPAKKEIKKYLSEFIEEDLIDDLPF